jgi:sulfite reductase alpha subunit-like flavoprotein
MADFDTSKLQDQQAIIVVASTFGDGDAPNNGEEFKKNLIKMRQENFKFRNINNESPRFFFS